MRPFEAALVGSREVGFTIVSITVSLVAVFLPILLMGGVIGRIFNEFAVVVTIAIIASALVSLTVDADAVRAPAGANGGSLRGSARAIEAAGPRPDAPRLSRGARFLPARAAARASGLLRNGRRHASISSRHRRRASCRRRISASSSVQTQARQDISFEDMPALQEKVAAALPSKPYVAHVGIGGRRRLRLVDLEHRQHVRRAERRSAPPLDRDPRATCAASLGQVPGISSFVVPVQNLRIGGVLVRQPIPVRRAGHRPRRALTGRPRSRRHGGMTATSSTSRPTSRTTRPQAQLVVDTDKARLLGITSEQLRNYLYDGFGTNQASTIFKTGDSYEVIVEFDRPIALDGRQAERPARSARRHGQDDPGLRFRAGSSVWPASFRSTSWASSRR